MTITKEEIKEKKRELIALRRDFKNEKEARRRGRIEGKRRRDKALDDIRKKTLEIKKLIYEWNKLGKADKTEADILTDIRQLTFMEEEAPEESGEESGPEENPEEEPEEVEEDGNNTENRE